MRDAVIVGAARTAVGRKGGKLSGIRPDDLAALDAAFPAPKRASPLDMN